LLVACTWEGQTNVGKTHSWSTRARGDVDALGGLCEANAREMSLLLVVNTLIVDPISEDKASAAHYMHREFSRCISG